MRAGVANLCELSSESGDIPGGINPGQREVAKSQTPRSGKRILVVDDLTAWLWLAKEILSAAGYHVQVCDHSPDALRLLTEDPKQIDLVITDLKMPCLDGIELAAELVKIKPALPVVLTSSAKVELTLTELQSLGIRDFLSKPWDRERLFSILRQTLASTRSDDTQ
jgi:CheY-like chemotaxis protein